jgi:hypothetical protein
VTVVFVAFDHHGPPAQGVDGLDHPHPHLTEADDHGVSLHPGGSLLPERFADPPAEQQVGKQGEPAGHQGHRQDNEDCRKNL